MPRFRLHMSCSTFLRNFVVLQEVYDDCIIFSQRADNIRQVKTILNKLLKFRIKINFKKYRFEKEEVDFLGYVVSKNGIKQQNLQTLKILEFRTPSNVGNQQWKENEKKMKKMSMKWKKFNMLIMFSLKPFKCQPHKMVKQTLTIL